MSLNVYSLGSRHSYSGESTVVPPPPEFPFLLPPPPRPHPTPLPSRGTVKLSSRRNLVQEANDLSEEEAEVDDALLAIRNRGAAFLIPLGKRYTLLEEKADLQTGSDDGSSEMEEGGSERGESPGEEDAEGEEEEEEHDLDASMENLDEEEEEEDEEDEEEEDDGEEEGSSGYESPEPEPLRRVP